MDITLVLLAFIFGACIGSFLNVCVYRLPRECLSISKPVFSFCPRCQKQIRFYDNIPLLSYVILGARCRDCRQPISIRYFCVELLTAVLFGLIAHSSLVEPLLSGQAGDRWDFLTTWVPLFFVQVTFTSALIVCSFIDIDLRIIPDSIDIPGMFLAPLACLLVPALHPDPPSLEQLVGWLLGPETAGSLGAWAWYANAQSLFASLLGVAAGAGLIWSIGLFGTWWFKREAMGFGDVKFMGMIGGLVGWDGVIIGFVAACMLGSVVGVVRLVFLHDRHIWFGPFLATGAFLMMMWRDGMLRLVLG